ncbi:MAG: DNA-packaging protein [Alphaproteobacteria bacterium]|nr:DNA-packaging protein [Alphaproteobacteria bacterium]
MKTSFARKLRNALDAYKTPEERFEWLKTFDISYVRYFNKHWWTHARPDQLPPDSNWLVWLLMGGRGAGKTRTGAEWVRARVLGHWPDDEAPARRIALVGPTLHDVRATMVEGVSGLLGVHRDHERPRFEPSLRRLTWPNGAVAQMFSAEEPDSLRGPAFDAAWADEGGAWKYGLETWQMLQFGMRMGDHPRQVMTTTPRSCPLLKDVMAAPGTVTTKAPTRANADHLSAAFLEAVIRRYGGTRLGRQELEGELLEDNPRALWQRGMIDRARVDKRPQGLARVVVAIDPPASAAAASSACGVVCAGVNAAGHGFVLEDATLERARPLEWANAAIRLYERYNADRLVAEVNQGGDMVEAVLRQVNAALPLTKVRATRGKHLRAEPVAALYEQGRVSHVGIMGLLEDRMCLTEPGAMAGAGDMDRLDALVWALTDLMLTGQAGVPRVRLL